MKRIVEIQMKNFTATVKSLRELSKLEFIDKIMHTGMHRNNTRI